MASDWCQHPKLGINTVTGGPQSARASEMRGTQGRCGNDWTRCGPKATWFEPNLRRRSVTWLNNGVNMADKHILILWSLYLTVLLWAPVVGPNPLVARRWALLVVPLSVATVVHLCL